MKYGIKLHPDEIRQDAWRELYGDPDRLFGEARACGAGFVELVFTEDMDPARLAELGRRACRQHLACSIHPYLLADSAPEVFTPAGGDTLEPLFDVAEELAGLSGEPVTLVFHGGRAGIEPHNRSRAEATAAAKAFFGWIDRRTRASHPNVRAFCETQYPVPPPEDDVWRRIGDTYESCLELVAATDLGICWDFGHTFASAWLGRHADLPGDAFLSRVGHVHAHDTARDGSAIRDHRELDTGICPWRAYCRLLAERGFDGRILFEIALKGLGGYDRLAAMLHHAIAEIDAIFAPA